MITDTTASRLRWRPRGMDVRLAVAVGVTFGAVALLVWVTWWNTARLIEEAHWVDQTKDVISELDGTFSAIKDAETSQRGFLLTGQDVYLDPYWAATAEIPRRLDRISALTAGDPQQKARAERLRRLAEERMKQLGTVLDLTRTGHDDAARSAIRTEAGRKTMEELRQLVGEMRMEQRALLALRTRRSGETAGDLVTTLAIGGGLLFGFLVLIWYLIRVDLRRRNESESAIRDREARIRRLVDANLIGVLFSDEEGVTDANEAFLAMAGIDRAAWKPREHRLFGFTAPEFRALDETCAKELRESGRCRPYQKELLRTDGSRVPVLFAATRLATEGGAAAVASFVVDLSELKRVEAERNRLYEEARDAVKARDAFLSVAGHEIRTPLSALNLFLYQLARQVRSFGNEKAVELAVRCERQVARLVRLTDELLDVSRLTAGSLHLDREEMDLSALAREVLDRMEEGARRAGCAVTLAASEPVTGFWDRVRLDQVLSNLLTNAMKFGAGEPIDVAVVARGDEANLSVKDGGIGIHDEDQRRIFRRFERAVPREMYQGMGLGLWIAREIAEAHGGTIRVESRPGAGALFTVLLPRHAGGEGEDPHH